MKMNVTCRIFYEELFTNSIEISYEYIVGYGLDPKIWVDYDHNETVPVPVVYGVIHSLHLMGSLIANAYCH